MARNATRCLFPTRNVSSLRNSEGYWPATPCNGHFGRVVKALDLSSNDASRVGSNPTGVTTFAEKRKEPGKMKERGTASVGDSRVHPPLRSCAGTGNSF